MPKNGQRVTIEIDGIGCDGTVRGVRPQRYILLEIGADAPKLLNKTEVTVRYMVEGGYNGFISRVLGHMPVANVVVLAFPEETYSSSVRNNERYLVSLPVIYSSGGRPTIGLIRDMSLSGVSLEADDQFAEGGKIEIGRIPFKGSAISGLSGKIKRVKALEGSQTAGIHFSHNSEAVSEALSSYLDGLARFEALRPDHEQTIESGADGVLPTGTPCFIEINGKKYTSSIRGYRPGRYLICDTPTQEGRPLLADRSMQIEATMRCMACARVFGFTSSLIMQYSSPVSLWVWNFPLNVEKLDLRKSARFKTLIPAELSCSDLKESAVALNLSRGGGLFAIEKELPIAVDDTIALAMEIASYDKEVTVEGTVRSVRVVGACQALGLSFERDQLKQWIDVFDRYINPFENQAPESQPQKSAN